MFTSSNGFTVTVKPRVVEILVGGTTAAHGVATGVLSDTALPGTPPSAVISWSAVTGAVSYMLHYGTVRSGNYTNHIPVTGTSFSLGGLTNGLTYFVCVTAVDSLGVQSPPSYETSFVMPRVGQIKYVATNGSDALGNGSITKPWLTIAKAMSTAVAGDTILLRAGTYREQVSFNGKNGTATNKFTIRSFDGEVATIDGTGVSVGQGALVQFINSSYVRFQALTVKNSSNHGVEPFTGSHHIEVVGNDVSACGGSGIWVENGSATANHTLIAGNSSHGNGQGGITLWVYTSGYLRIAYNDSFSNQGGGNYDGIQIGGGSGAGHHVVVKRNHAFNNNAGNNFGADNLDLGGHAINHHYLVEENVVDNASGNTAAFKCNSGDPGFYTAELSGYHIVRFNTFHNLLWDMYENPNPVVAYNNTYYDCGIAHQIGFFNGTTPVSLGDSGYARWKALNSLSDTDYGRYSLKDSVFYHNGTVNGVIFNWGSPIADTSYKSLRFQNNIYKGGVGQTFQWSSFPTGSFPTYPITASGLQQFQAFNSPNNPDTGSTVATTLVASMFRNGPGGDYRLVSTSPAKGNVPAVTTTLNAGSSSTTLVLDRASYFTDGYPNGGELLSEPDYIQIGTNAPVQIVSIADLTNTITLASAQTWSAGTGVWLANPLYPGGPAVKNADYGAKPWVSDSQLAAPAGFLTVGTITPS